MERIIKGMSFMALFVAVFLPLELKVLAEGSAADSEGTIYVAHWTHTPENCPGRTREGAKMLSDFHASFSEASRKGIKILGAYVTVTEHDYYIIVQAKDYASVAEFFLPLVPTQTGSFRPVLPMEEWIKINQPR
jgi:uncharacterized protein with GYD domain